MAEQTMDPTVATTDNPPPSSGSTATAVLEAPSAPVTARQAVETAFTQAESDPSSDSSPVVATPGVPAGPATATTVPSAPVVTKTSDPIPFDRHEAALRNVRETAAREVQAVKDSFAWAANIKPTDVTQAVDLLRALTTNPKAFYQQLGSELEGSDLKDPDPDLVSADGKHRAFSSTAVATLLKNQEARLRQAILGELKPTIDFATTSQERATQERATADAHAFATETLTRMRDLTGFKEHESRIKTVYDAMDPATKAKLGGYVAALYHAYQQVFTEQVLPTLNGKVETEVLTGLKKAATSSAGSVVPGQGAAGKAKRPTNPRELAEFLRSSDGAASL